MNKHIDRAKRWINNHPGQKLPHHLAERAHMVPPRASRPWGLRASKYMPHEGKQECARRVRQEGNGG